MKTYNKLRDFNKTVENDSDKVKLNAYHSPSPMNEWCDYICTWKRKILWDNNIDNLIDTRCLIVNNSLNLNDKNFKICRKYINEYADSLRKHLETKIIKSEVYSEFAFDEFVKMFKRTIKSEIAVRRRTNCQLRHRYVYRSMSISKIFCLVSLWRIYY